MLYNLLYWVCRRPGRRLKAGQLYWVHLPPLEGEKEVIAYLELRAHLGHLVLAAEGALLYFAHNVLGRVGKMGFESTNGVQSRVRIHPNLPKLVRIYHFPSSVLHCCSFSLIRYKMVDYFML